MWYPGSGVVLHCINSRPDLSYFQHAGSREDNLIKLCNFSKEMVSNVTHTILLGFLAIFLENCAEVCLNDDLILLLASLLN